MVSLFVPVRIQRHSCLLQDTCLFSSVADGEQNTEQKGGGTCDKWFEYLGKTFQNDNRG